MGEQALTTFVETVCGESHLRVEDDLGDGFVRLRSAEAERRQAAHDIRSTEDAVIEMLRNARDADARNIFLAVNREGSTRRLVMIDDGCGVPPAMHEKIFEPRVTSKLDTMHFDKWGVHGRGMALYSIKANAEQAYLVLSDTGMGTSLVVETNLEKLSEKSDQSTFPQLEPKDDGTYLMRGPKNIVRTACEFALESKKTCAVYLGSSTDIAATLYAFGSAALPASAKAFVRDVEEVPVCKRLALAADPAEFAAIAAELGLIISERSARRAMDGTIAPLDDMLEKLRGSGFGQFGASKSTAARRTQDGKGNAAKDRRGLRLTDADAHELGQKVRKAYADIAPRYYLDPNVEPAIRVNGDAIRITIPVEKIS